MSVWQLERDILTYPFWATGPWFPRARLFIAVLSAFFHIGWSCALFVSMHLALKSSATVSLEVLWGLPLPLSISTECIFLSVCHFFPHAQTILDDLTTALIPKVQDSITCTLLTDSLCLQLISFRHDLFLLNSRIPPFFQPLLFVQLFSRFCNF